MKIIIISVIVIIFIVGVWFVNSRKSNDEEAFDETKMWW